MAELCRPSTGTSKDPPRFRANACGRMKTNTHIDPLLRRARKLAEHKRATLGKLMEPALRRDVTEARPDTPFELRSANFKDKGIASHMRGESCDTSRRIWPKKVAGHEIPRSVFADVREPRRPPNPENAPWPPMRG